MATPTSTLRVQPPTSNIESLISKMTLEQKVGQVMLVGFDGTTLTPEFRDDLTQLHIGGVVFYERNVQSPSQVAQLNADLQNAAMQNGDPALFLTVDQEGGIVTRMREDKGFTEFPGQMAIGATGDPNNARRIAQAISHEMLALGFNMDLTPDLDVNNNPANPVIGTRSFGSDPKHVAEFGAAFIDGMQSAGMIAIGKHFPGHGDTGVDSHIALPTVPYNRARLESVEFVPFKAAMQANIAGIMSAHITFPAIDSTPGLAATLSPKVLTDLIRSEMKYDGLVMTDELTMGALATSGYPAPQAASAALKAGADVLLFQTGYTMHRQVHAMLVDHVQRGIIPRRILLVKERFGILSGTAILSERSEPKDATQSKDMSQVGSAETKTISRDVAMQAVTLVRDDAKLLPLKPDAKLLVVETGAYGLGKLLAVTTMQVAANIKKSEIDSILQIARDGRTVIVATSDAARNPGQVELVSELKKANVPTIVVATRSPYDLMYLKDVTTYLAIYGSNPPMIEAVAAVLTGKAKAQGKLPVEIP